MHNVSKRTASFSTDVDLVLPAALPMTGQQLSTIMEHGIHDAERRIVSAREQAGRRRALPQAWRWRIRRNPRARLQRLMTPAMERKGKRGRAVAMLTFEDSSEGAILLDTFETKLLEASDRVEDFISLLRLGFESDQPTVEAAFAAIRRLVLAGAFILLDSAHPEEE